MQFLLNGLIAGSAYALVALSFALIYTPTRFFHFARGGGGGLRVERVLPLHWFWDTIVAGCEETVVPEGDDLD
jgi:hypothetical protein